jgi:hypothetical protein
MPASRSPYTRSERREKAFDLFRKGYGPTDVGRKLKVSKNTALALKRRYEEAIKDEVRQRPDMMSDVLGNTLRSLEELDLVRKDAWRRLEGRSDHECPECGTLLACSHSLPIQSATQLHGVILKAQEQRVKLFGLMGVKQEYFIHVQNIQVVQMLILEFLQNELCEADRMKFTTWMDERMPQLTQGSSENALPILDVDSEEVTVPAL